MQDDEVPVEPVLHEKVRTVIMSSSKSHVVSTPSWPLSFGLDPHYALDLMQYDFRKNLKTPSPAVWNKKIDLTNFGRFDLLSSNPQRVPTVEDRGILKEFADTEPEQPKPLRKVLMPGSKSGRAYVMVTEECERAIFRMYKESESIKEGGNRITWVLSQFERLVRKYGDGTIQSEDEPAPMKKRVKIMSGSKSASFREVEVTLPKPETEKKEEIPDTPTSYPNTR